MAALFDLDKPGKYPIVLSDALLGKTSKEVYTGVRYNHKPDPSSNSKVSSHIEPSDSDPTSYDLSLQENKDKYGYRGVRTSADGQYVLIFDPAKKHFVLHRVDSTFDMNLISAPWTQDEDNLRNHYDQLNPTPSKAVAATQPKRRPSKTTKAAAATKSEPKPRKKVEKPTKPKPPPREPTPEEEDESDDGLTIEYPDGPSSQQYTYQPTPVFQRNESESEEDSDMDAEGEDDDMERNQDVDHLKLPSPANNAGGMSDEDMELDLEAELERELEAAGNESSESEEE
ncbi:RNA polymerase II transcription elongation factor-domain-containing protein [Tricladium varicosporioides]|nr:RNA polymerase II transcription elongation factor-domain-containing protein [Hymenoscyphus varicosporioides]